MKHLRHSKFLSLVTLSFALAFFVTACQTTSWTVYQFESSESVQYLPSPTQILLHDSSTVVLRAGRIEGDSIKGMLEVERGVLPPTDNFALHAADIRSLWRLERTGRQSGFSTLEIVGMGLTAVFVVGVIEMCSADNFFNC
jgi:hypothetical protein